MKIYLDDDSAASTLVALLRKEGHDVVIPHEASMDGAKDAAHFMHTIQDARVLLTHNHDDFELLHELVMLAKGHHPGVLTVCRDNDPTRDLTPKGIVRAIRRLIDAQAATADQLHILNHWR